MSRNPKPLPKLTTIAIATVVALATLAPSPGAWADTVSPGKNVAASAGPTSGMVLAGPAGFSVDLARAKRKTLVLIDGMVSVAAYDVTTDLSLQVYAQDATGNAIVVAQGSNIQTRCGAAASCTLTGHWWLDIDKVEAENPGVWANKPIQLQLRILTVPGNAYAGAAWYSFTAQIVKK